MDLKQIKQLKDKHRLTGYNKMRDSRQSYVPKSISKDSDVLITNYININKQINTVLDFGCGSKGSFKIPKNINYYGFDYDTLNDFATYNNLKDITKKYDLIVCRAVLEHMSVDEIKENLLWMKKHSKYLILSVPLLTSFNVHEMFCDSTHNINSWTFLYSHDFLYYIENVLNMKIKDYIFCTPLAKNPIKTMIQKINSWAYNTVRYYDYMVILECGDDKN